MVKTNKQKMHKKKKESIHTQNMYPLSKKQTKKNIYILNFRRYVTGSSITARPAVYQK